MRLEALKLYNHRLPKQGDRCFKILSFPAHPHVYFWKAGVCVAIQHNICERGYVSLFDINKWCPHQFRDISIIAVNKQDHCRGDWLARPASALHFILCATRSDLPGNLLNRFTAQREIDLWHKTGRGRCVQMKLKLSVLLAGADGGRKEWILSDIEDCYPLCSTNQTHELGMEDK